MTEAVPGIVDVERFGGGVPRLLVEVPHGADSSDFERVASRLRGDLPPDLVAFFHLNTDVAAWDYGRRVAQRVAAAHPDGGAVVLRCRVPRTLIDCNRRLEASEAETAAGGVTPGLPSYVENPGDRVFLRGLHQSYVAVAEAAWTEVCGRGGFALVPHTYGPHTLPIDRIEHDIVERLRAAHQPEVLRTCPLRPEVDLLLHDMDGRLWAPDDAEELLVEAFSLAGFLAQTGTTYRLHPSTMAWQFATRFPQRSLCLEVRRDLLVERWLPFQEKVVDIAAIERVADALTGSVVKWMAR